MNPRRLFRTNDRQLAGVAGGMAEYLDVDPTIVRILWILGAIFTGGLLIFAYIILAFVIPQAPYRATATATQGWAAPAGPASQPGTGIPAWGPDWAARAEAERRAQERSRGRGPGAGVIVGVILVVFGVIALADSVLPGWVETAVVGPAIVIALGAALLVGAVGRRDDRRESSAETPASGAASDWAIPTASTAPAAADAPATDEPFVTRYDADATAPVDLDLPPAPVDRRPDTDPR